MFKRVLVATDFSAHADHTLACIGEIPGLEEILLVHVINRVEVPPPSPVFRHSRITAEEQARRTLEEKRIFLEQMTGVPVRALLLEGVDGDIAGAIVKEAQKENIPLVIMGGRGHGILLGLILGSVSEGVIRRSKADVLIMHFRGAGNPGEEKLEKFCRNIFSNVLCPVDFSRPSENTIAYAQNLGCIRRVTLLHVLTAGTSNGEQPARVRDAERQMDAIRTALGASGTKAASIIRTGNPADEICHVAEEEDVSLIMIARVGLSDYTKNIPLGRVVAGVTTKAERPLFVVNPHISLNVSARELDPAEFLLAEQVWKGYHQQKGDTTTDRIFGVFVEGTLAAVARCRRHTDGREVDGVFVPEEYRGRGYARKVMQALVEACGMDPLFMHATLELVDFYKTLGFIPIGEHKLPHSIMERFDFADGDLEGADVQPMQRTVPG
jgi:nucleotide-binding universal stress UspA family protein/GNAT superfamily N-acetyltransferase